MGETIAVHGHSGAVQGGNGASNVQEWSGTLVEEEVMATNMDGEGYQDVIPGTKGCSGSFTCIGVAPTTGISDSLVLITDSAEKVKISGKALISQVEVSSTATATTPVTYSANFRYKAAFTVEIAT
jgi:hypothetical protein